MTPQLCRSLLVLVALVSVQCQTPGSGAESAAELPSERPKGQLEVVARMNGPAPAGVAVTEGGRVFVSFPRWDPGVDATVAEWVDGRLVPYPGPDVNNPDKAAPSKHLLSVENLTIGPDGDLWLLDTGRPNFDETVSGGAKLVCVDLANDEIVETIVFPDDVARTDSYLADLAVDPNHGDSGMAYVTDASPSGTNGLVVVDLASGQARRELDLHPSTRASPEFVPIVEGRPMFFEPEGWGRDYMSLGANGIAVAPDDDRVYYAPMASRRVYSVDAAALADPEVRSDAVAATILTHGNTNFASDGMAYDGEHLYLGNYEHNAVMRMRPGGESETLLHDPRLLWPDALDAVDGQLYILTNQRHRGGVFNRGRDLRETPYLLFKTSLEATGE